MAEVLNPFGTFARIGHAIKLKKFLIELHDLLRFYRPELSEAPFVFFRF